MTDDAFARALVAELAKKTGVSWVRHGDRTYPVWHAWVEDALCLVSGGDEQPLPDLRDDDRVEILMRSKDNGGRLITWVGAVEVVAPGTPAWEPVTAALVAGRLNAADLSSVAKGWARTSVVRRIIPTGEVTETPGALSGDAHRAAPLPTAATTRGPLPKVLHRRVKRRPTLS